MLTPIRVVKRWIRKGFRLARKWKKATITLAAVSTLSGAYSANVAPVVASVQTVVGSVEQFFTQDTSTSQKPKTTPPTSHVHPR